MLNLPGIIRSYSQDTNNPTRASSAPSEDSAAGIMKVLCTEKIIQKSWHYYDVWGPVKDISQCPTVRKRCVRLSV
jgi:hypothetical protein